MSENTKTGEEWWKSATHRMKVRLMRQMGFGDVQAYAGYRWEHFTERSRNEIHSIITKRRKGNAAVTP